MTHPTKSLPKHGVTDEDIGAYASAGVVCLRDMFEREWLDYLAPAVDEVMAAPGPHAEDYTRHGPGRFYGDLSVWERHTRFRQFVLHSPAAAIAAGIMRSGKLNFFYDQLLVKEANTREVTPWHQDQPYWAVDGWQVCSIWLPIDAVKRQNSVHFVRGSHRWGESYNPHHFIDDTPYEGTGLPELPDIGAEPEKYEIVAFDLEPGDCLVFHGMIIHGAPGNASKTSRRRAYSTRWTGDDAPYAERPGEVGFPVEPPGLKHGDAMDCEMFPRVWPR